MQGVYLNTLLSHEQSILGYEVGQLPAKGPIGATMICCRNTIYVH